MLQATWAPRVLAVAGYVAWMGIRCPAAVVSLPTHHVFFAFDSIQLLLPHSGSTMAPLKLCRQLLRALQLSLSTVKCGWRLRQLIAD